MKKILLLDDQPNITKLMASELKTCGYDVFCAHCMRDGELIIDALKNKNENIEVVVIDLLLNRFEPSFAAEQSMVGEAMSRAKLSEIPSGQAFGLRIWQARTGGRIPYCYMSAHPQYWMPDLGSPAEFQGADKSELMTLQIEKGRVRGADFGGRLDEVIELWKKNRWC